MYNNESMTMGSPTNHLYHHSSPPQSPYLPAFLMGEPYTMNPLPSVRPSWTNTVATTPPRNANLRRSMTTTTTPYGYRGNASRRDTLGRDQLPNSGNSPAVNTRNKDKPSAPPVMGLMESFTQNTSLPFRKDEEDCSVLSRSFGRGGGANGAPGMPNQTFADLDKSPHMFNASHRSGSIAISPHQTDSFYAYGNSVCGAEEGVEEDTWVTVFGFPAAQTSFILDEFSHYGNIIKHVISPSGNWLRIQYQNKVQAKRALSKNGKVFAGNVMVGVTTTNDKDVTCDIPGMVNDTTAAGLSGTLRNKVGRSASMRPLTSAYQTHRDPETTVMRKLPRKDRNVLSKAMEYVFGW